MAARTLAHADSGGRVRVWSQHGAVFCEFRDTGTIGDLQASRERPPDDVIGGLGLRVVRQVCDAVDIHDWPGGTTIRLCMSLPGPAPPS